LSLLKGKAKYKITAYSKVLNIFYRLCNYVFRFSKTFAELGAILIALGELFSPFLTLIGAILLLIGVNGLANYYGERGIFNNFLFGFIIALIGTVVIILIVLPVHVTAAQPYVQTLNTISPPIGGVGFGSGSIWSFIASSLQVIILPLIDTAFAIIAVIFFRRGILILKEKSGIDLFATSALILLIGAILIAVFIGSFISLIGWIILAVAFFIMKPKEFSQVQQITSQQI